MVCYISYPTWPVIECRAIRELNEKSFSLTSGDFKGPLEIWPVFELSAHKAPGSMPTCAI